MSDAMDGPSGTLETWKIVLAILLPLSFASVAAAFVFWLRHRRHKTQRKQRKGEEAARGTQLDDLRPGTSNDDSALAERLETTLQRIKRLEDELKMRDTNRANSRASWIGSQHQDYTLAPPAPWSTGTSPMPSPRTPTPGARSFSTTSGPRPLSGSSRPLSGSTLFNTSHQVLPHSAPGLELLPRPRSDSGTTESVYTASRDSHGSNGSKYHVPPSTIPEESSAGAVSPFHDNGPHVLEDDDDESLHVGEPRDNLLSNGNDFDQAVQPKSLHFPLAGLSPLRSNPTHPDLVPMPLAIMKRNSVRESTSRPGSGLSQASEKIIQRSVSNPVSARSYLQDAGNFATPPMQGKTINESADESTGIMTPPPTALLYLRERLDGGNAVRKLPATSGRKSPAISTDPSKKKTNQSSKSDNRKSTTPSTIVSVRPSPQPGVRIMTPPASKFPPPPGPPPSRPTPPPPRTSKTQDEEVKPQSPTRIPQPLSCGSHARTHSNIRPLSTSSHVRTHSNTRPFKPKRTQVDKMNAVQLAGDKLREMRDIELNFSRGKMPTSYSSSHFLPRVGTNATIGSSIYSYDDIEYMRKTAEQNKDPNMDKLSPLKRGHRKFLSEMSSVLNFFDREDSSML